MKSISIFLIFGMQMSPWSQTDSVTVNNTKGIWKVRTLSTLSPNLHSSLGEAVIKLWSIIFKITWWQVNLISAFFHWGQLNLSVMSRWTCLSVCHVERDLSVSGSSSSSRAHFWILPLPNRVKTRAPQALTPADKHNTVLQAARERCFRGTWDILMLGELT